VPTEPVPADPAERPVVKTIDPRGARFAAGVTSLVLAVSLALGAGWGVQLLVLQGLVFAAAAVLGMASHPYIWVFRTFIRPRLGAPARRLEAAPSRFAATVGLVFALLGTFGALAALPVVFYVAVGFALVVALVNAVFDLCLVCELYLATRRLASFFGTAG
jgi:hypothetical protein